MHSLICVTFGEMPFFSDDFLKIKDFLGPEALRNYFWCHFMLMKLLSSMLKLTDAWNIECNIPFFNLDLLDYLSQVLPWTPNIFFISLVKFTPVEGFGVFFFNMYLGWTQIFFFVSWTCVGFILLFFDSNVCVCCFLTSLWVTWLFACCVWSC